MYLYGLKSDQYIIFLNKQAYILSFLEHLSKPTFSLCVIANCCTKSHRAAIPNLSGDTPRDNSLIGPSFLSCDLVLGLPLPSVMVAYEFSNPTN